MSFPDASFGSLGDCSSVEAGVICLERPVSRNGPILCVGHLLHSFPHKIRKNCKSSLSSECLASIAAIGYSLWYKTLLVEIMSGLFIIHRLTAEEQLPLLTPFERSLSEGEGRSEWERDQKETTKILAQPLPKRQVAIQGEEGGAKIVSSCEKCNVANIMTLSSIRQGYDMIGSRAMLPDLHTLVLTD